MLKLRRATVIDAGPPDGPERELPVAVLALHRQLAPVAWAFARAAPGLRLGYVQTAGGAMREGHSRSVGVLCERELLAGHLITGSTSAGAAEAITTVGALDHGLGALGWDAAVCGPGPSAGGSGSSLEAGSLCALESRTRRARARLPGAAGRADVSPIAGQPQRGISEPDADRAGPAARPRHRRAARRRALPRRRRAARRPRSGVRWRLTATAGARAAGRAARAHHAPRLASRRGRPAGVRGLDAAAPDARRRSPAEPLLFAAALAAGVVLAQLARSAGDRALPSPLRDHRPGEGAQRGEAKLGA